MGAREFAFTAMLGPAFGRGGGAPLGDSNVLSEEVTWQRRLSGARQPPWAAIREKCVTHASANLNSKKPFRVNELEPPTQGGAPTPNVEV